MADYFDPEKDDGRGYEETSSNKKSGWWWKDYDYDYRDYSYTKGSGSRSWMSKIGHGYGSDDWWKPKKNENEVYQDLLDQLQNSANIIGDNDSGKVVVHWSNGADVNSPKPDGSGCHNIYLSPDNLLSNSSRGKEVSEEVLDAMTGKVYLASTLRETVSPEAYSQAKSARSYIAAKAAKVHPNSHCLCGSGMRFSSCCRPKFAGESADIVSNAVTIWEAIETSIARSKIMEDWSGFGPCIACDAERSSDTKQQVQDFIDASAAEPSVDAAATAIAWNLLNSSDPIQIPDCYDDCIDAASEMMEEEIDADDRFSSCHELTEKIYQILKKKKCDPSDGDGDESSSKDEDDGDEDKDDGDEDESEGEGGKSEGKPKVCDGSLLGETVSNSTNTELSEQEASDDSAKTDEEKAEIEAKAPDALCDLGKDYKLLKMDAKPSNQTDYKTVVTSHRSEISAIRSSLMFRNNTPKMVSYGHRSGDIDENSLFKIRMNDDRVMTKQDAVSTKKIAICLLVDESGSMGAGNKVARFEEARNVAIVMAESLRGMDGIEVSIYGHSAEEYMRDCEGVVLREYYSPRQKNLASCMEITARQQNHDSYAILHTANLFNRDFHEYDRKIMFVISDGEPAGSNYGGKPARKHMNDVSQACSRKGLEVYGIGIDDAFSDKSGKEMYGENKFVVLKDVQSSLGIMARFIRQIAMK